MASNLSRNFLGFSFARKVFLETPFYSKGNESKEHSTLENASKTAMFSRTVEILNVIT